MSAVSAALPRFVSPFRYPGGKSWLVPTLLDWVSKEPPVDVFVEPFAGGASVGLSVAASGLARKVVLVEIDPDVAAVWSTIIDGSDADVERLFALLMWFTPERGLVERIIAREPADTVERAFRTLVKNRCQRGGVMAPGAGLLRTGEDGKGLASRWYPETLRVRIAYIRDFRQRITFIHGDGLVALTSTRRPPSSLTRRTPSEVKAQVRASTRTTNWITSNCSTMFPRSHAAPP